MGCKVSFSFLSFLLILIFLSIGTANAATRRGMVQRNDRLGKWQRLNELTIFILSLLSKVLYGVDFMLDVSRVKMLFV